MTHASYSLRPAGWLVWRWRAEADDGWRSHSGAALGRAMARRRARAWLRRNTSGRKGPQAAVPPAP